MEVTCQGLPAFWINGWLAAVGATVLDDRIRLHWTTGDHLAVLSVANCDPVDALVESWPSKELLENLPIARKLEGTGVLQRNVMVDSFRQRASAVRVHPYSWTLSSTMTDLSVDEHGMVAHAPFDPPVQRGLVLHDRLLKIHKHVVQPSVREIRASLDGKGQRVQVNGLGFDAARIGSQADKTDPWTDPVVEMLAFFGLAMLPMRAHGVDGLPASKTASDRGCQRGWRKPADSQKGRCFHWPAWGQPLNADGIDALLDVWSPEKKGRWASLGLHAAWRSVAYKTDNKQDVTRAYGSEQL